MPVTAETPRETDRFPSRPRPPRTRGRGRGRVVTLATIISRARPRGARPAFGPRRSGQSSRSEETSGAAASRGEWSRCRKHPLATAQTTQNNTQQHRNPQTPELRPQSTRSSLRPRYAPPPVHPQKKGNAARRSSMLRPQKNHHSDMCGPLALYVSLARRAVLQPGPQRRPFSTKKSIIARRSSTLRPQKNHHSDMWGPLALYVSLARCAAVQKGLACTQ